MAADYTFDPGIVFDDTTLTPAIAATGVLLNVAGGTAQQVYNLNGSPIPNLTTNNKGYVARFKAGIPDGVLSFGSILQPVYSIESVRSGGLAQQARDEATQASDAAQQASTLAAQAAAAAQQAQAAAQAAATSAAQGGSVSLSSVDTYAGGSLSNFFARNLMPNVASSTGVYPARPTCLVCLWIGPNNPGTTLMQPNDIWAERTTG